MAAGDPARHPWHMHGTRRPGGRLILFGGLLCALAWVLNWSLPGLRTHLFFFPQWLGYVLLVEGWTQRRTGTSGLARSPRAFALLFLASVPAWWLFELFNLRLANWEYLGRERFSDLEYALLASLSFSTVLPAVLATAELLRSLPALERFARGPRLGPSRPLLLALFVAGVGAVVLMLAWPRVFFPFAWIGPVLVLEPTVRWLGRRSLLDDLARGDWREWIALWGAGLACGFLWEAWNFHSYPKWIYHIPGVDFWRVFEMPILGYLGYLPFALELWLLRALFFSGRERGEARTPR
jgi:hypothetical protein